MTRIAIVGSGSAGRRHLAALRSARPDAEIVVVRRPDSPRPVDDLRSQGATVVATIDEALSASPDLGVVAGPATHHRGAAVALADAGAHLFVEKPLAADLPDARAIVDAAASRGVHLVVGYHLRFADTARRFVELVGEGAVGRPIEVDLRVAQHLAQWRAGIDPRQSVTARRDLGGGVLLELSHEIDAALQLLGPVEVVSTRLRHDGAPTDGLVETVADLDVRAASGATGHVHLDMVADDPVRRWTVTGTDGTLVADLLAGRITGRDGAGDVVIATAEAGERDRAERRLVDHVLDVVAGRADPACTGADGLAALTVVDAARRQSELVA